jgi:6-phosphogluconolactonase
MRGGDDVTRRTPLRALLAAILVPAAGDALRVFIGTYTGGESRGIYRLEIDAATGGLVSGPTLAAASENPSFLALHPSGKVLYAVNEVADFRGATTGAVSAFAVDPIAGSLALLDQQPSEGADPCHVTVDGAGRHLLVANYTAGTVAVLPLAADGRIEPASAVRRYAGSGPNASRQEGPHAHQVLLDATQRYALCADLGSDRIRVERYDEAAGRLTPNEPGEVALDPGSGPRHLAWHPSAPLLYAINELRSTVTALRWDTARGTLTPFQTISSLPEAFAGENTAAEIAVSSDGRFVYASNRGADSLAVFAAGPSGALSPVASVSTGGRTPRSFAIDPTGRWLVAANQGSNAVVVFRIDPETGLPRAAGTPIPVPEPTSILFTPSHRPGKAREMP